METLTTHVGFLTDINTPHSLRKLIEWKHAKRRDFTMNALYSSLAEETN